LIPLKRSLSGVDTDAVFERTGFPGAGASAEREFGRLRALNMADDWKVWLGSSGLALAFVVWSEFVNPNAARVLDLGAGFLLGILLVV